MNNKKIVISTLILISLIMISIVNIPTSNEINILTDKNCSVDQTNDNPINEDPLELENLEAADVSEDQLNHNFSFNTNLHEIWYRSWNYLNCNSTKGENPSVMLQDGTYGYNITYEFNITELRDSDTMNLISVGDLSSMYLIQYNGTQQEWVNLGQINDDGIGKGSLNGYIRLNRTVPGYFTIPPWWFENINITYNATMKFTVITNATLVNNFKPDIDNTVSDYISWEIYYVNSYISTYIPGEYKAILDVDRNYSLISALGYDDNYWIPLNSTTDDTHIYLNESYPEYKIEVQTPNLVSIVYNDNLTYNDPYKKQDDQNELRLYVTCKMAGELDIRFKLTNGTVLNDKTTVLKDEIVFFNHIMEQNATGGIGYLNVTLTNNTLSRFGVRIREITFHKQAGIMAFSSNTTAFSLFFVLTGYVDLDTNQYYYYNPGSLTSGEILNKSVIPNATVTYEFAGFTGELDLGPLYIQDFGVYINLYYTMIDLREVLIKPGIYNITFKAYRQGYTTLESTTLFNISKSNVYIYIQPEPDDRIFTIEEIFSLYIIFAVVIPVEPHFELFLRYPVFVNLTFINNDTGEIELETQWMGPDSKPLPVLQSITISGPMDNTTLPGNYILNVTIDSAYYNGSTTIPITVKEKILDLSLVYDDEVDEDEDFDINWALENANFTGNRENMTLEIYVDGVLYKILNLTTGSSGITTLDLKEGDHIITYRIVSPFYTAERSAVIESVEEKSKPKEKSWLEENWLLLLILLLIIIAMSTFGIYMAISRRKVKAQRALDSELVALRTKVGATEDNITLIKTQISQISGIYWILVIHSEQGTTMVEISDFRFKEVLGEKYQEYVVTDTIRDSALIGGFLTAIRNFSRETSGTVQETIPIFNSQTDYSTIVNDKEVHRRILEGADYFMAFMSSRETLKISDVLASINSKFRDGYEEHVKEFVGKVVVFKPFEEEVVSYLHNEIRELEKKLNDESMLLEHYHKHLKEVQEKIGIKKNI